MYSKFPIPVTLLVDRYSTPLTFAVVAAVVSLLLIGLVVTFYCKYCSGPLPGEEGGGPPLLKKDLEQQNFEKGKGVGKKKKKRTPKTPRDNNKETLLAFRQHRRSPNKKPKDGQVEVEEEGQGEESGEGTSSGTPSTSEAFTEKKTDNNTDTTTTTTTSSNKKPQPPVVTVPKRTMSEVL